MIKLEEISMKIDKSCSDLMYCLKLDQTAEDLKETKSELEQLRADFIKMRDEILQGIRDQKLQCNQADLQKLISMMK